MTSQRKRQTSRRLNDGGVTGYRHTQRIEDLGGIVLSEFLNPRDIRLDRILNSGYLAIERPPRQQKRRDVLVVGMMPPSVVLGPGGGFLKACWFDCMWRFATFLRSHDLYRSEIRWIESDRIDRFRSTSHHLQHMPQLLPAERLNEGDRWMFLKSLRWVPALLNRRDRTTPLPPRRSPTQPDRPAEWSWCIDAWSAQREAYVADTAGAAQRTWAAAVAEFAHVHIMAFLPAVVLPNEQWPELRAWRALLPGFGVAASTGGYVSLTWVPTNLPATRQWRFVSKGEQQSVPDAAKTPELLAGCLEQLWLERLIKDMHRA